MYVVGVGRGLFVFVDSRDCGPGLFGSESMEKQGQEWEQWSIPLRDQRKATSPAGRKEDKKRENASLL